METIAGEGPLLTKGHTMAKRIAALIGVLILGLTLTGCSHDAADIEYSPVTVTVNNKTVDCIAMIDYYNGESAFSCNWYGYAQDNE